MNDILRPTPPECPTWCRLPAGHRYESETPDGLVLTRLHELPVSPVAHPTVSVAITATESVMSGYTARCRPHLYVNVEGELTADGARALAELLGSAADQLERLSDGGDG